MVLILDSGIALSNVRKLEESHDGYVVITQDGVEGTTKQPIYNIKAMHEER